LVGAIAWSLQTSYALNGRVSTVESRITESEKKLTSIEGKIDSLPLKISESLLHHAADLSKSKQPTQASQTLQLASVFIASARSAKVQPDSEYFQNATMYVKDLDTNTPEVTAQAHDVLSQLAAYRSAIEPAPPTNGDKKPVDTSVRTQLAMRVNVKLLLGAYIVPVYIHSADVFTSPEPKKLSNNIVVSGPAVFVGAVSDAQQTLDGIRWEDVTFFNMKIRYLGGELALQNVKFVNCAFELPGTPNGLRFAETVALAASSLNLG
jgi:hypothetical protein